MLLLQLLQVTLYSSESKPCGHMTECLQKETDFTATHSGLPHWELLSPEADLQQFFGVSGNVQELQAGGLLLLNNRGSRCSWEGLALLDSILPTMLLELEMFFKKQYTSRKTNLQRDG